MYALVAVDLYEDDEQRFDDLVPLLDRLHATTRLIFVDVARPPTGADLATPELVSLLAAQVRRREADQREHLDGLLDRLPADRRAGTLILDRRDAARAIVEQAPGHDLVVLRTHGRHGAERLWLGSVAERAVRTSPIPVLVVHTPLQAPAADGRIVAAVDLDEGAQTLAEEAARWALAFRAPVDAVYVRPQILAGALPAAWTDHDRQAHERAVARLEAWLDQLPPEARGAARVERGDPASALVAAAKGALVVMVGTHGRQGARRFWIGSVAERVVRTSSAPVLVLPLW